jgi:transketolase C-terminal domain/subunit
MVAVIDRVFFDRGLRFVFSTRSKVPHILKEDGKTRYFGDGYKFIPGKDEVIVEGTAGYVVSFGEMLYRSWDAVLRCRQTGLDVGLINKPTLNIIDEEVRIASCTAVTPRLIQPVCATQTLMKIGQSPFVLVVETFNQKTGVSCSASPGHPGLKYRRYTARV